MAIYFSFVEPRLTYKSHSLPRRLLKIQRMYRRTSDAQRITAKDKKAGPFKDGSGNIKFFTREFMQRTSLRRPSRGVVT